MDAYIHRSVHRLGGAHATGQWRQGRLVLPASAVVLPLWSGREWPDTPQVFGEKESWFAEISLFVVAFPEYYKYVVDSSLSLLQFKV